MSDYTKELEDQVEALKAALDKERDWNDFMHKRKLSQKYRRWCTKYVMKFHNVPEADARKVPLKYCYFEDIFENLNDARSSIRNTLNDLIDDYYSDWLIKMHKKIKGKDKPSVRIGLEISLYDQRKDKDVFTKTLDMNLVYSGKEHGVCVVRIHGLEPGEVMEIDEVILPLVHPDDEYINKWEKHRGEDGGIREDTEG